MTAADPPSTLFGTSASGDGAAPVPADAGRRLGDYVVLRELGRGGQGAVYLAEDARLRRQVALKVLEGFGAAGGEAAERFRREALAVSSLNHPGICTVFEARLDARPPFLAMQYVPGETLAARISATKSKLELSASGSATGATMRESVDLTTGAEPEAEAPPRAAAPSRRASLDRAAVMDFVRIAEAAARALHAAHERGVVHRDVKPGNVMIGADGAPVLLDFGLARREETDGESLTRAGELCGTPAYMSPEQLGRGAARIDLRTDVWSLGATLYECLALRRPFGGATREALFREILTRESEPLRAACPAAPRDLAVVVATALAKEPDRRYRTALDFAEDLRRVRESEPILARPPGPFARAALFARRAPAAAALLATLFVTLPAVAALGVSWAKDRPAAEAARCARVEEERQALLAEASYVLAEGDPADAAGILERAFAIDGGSPEAAAWLVLAEVSTKRPERAAEALSRALPLLGDGVAARELSAIVDRVRGVAESSPAAASRPTDDSAPAARTVADHALLAQRELNAGEKRRGLPDGGRAEFKRAIDHATRAILLAPAPRFDLYALRAHAAGHLDDVPTADATARALRARWPHLADAHRWASFALANAANERGRAGDEAAYDEAIAAGREALRIGLSGSDAEVVVRANLGMALANRGFLEAAVVELTEAARLGPSCAEVWYSLAGAERELGRMDACERAARRAVEADLRGPVARTLLGEILIGADRYAEAAEILEPAARDFPEDVQSAWALSIACEQIERVEDAVDLLRRVVALRPEFPEAWCNLGLALRKIGRYAEGRDALARGHAQGSARADWSYPSGDWLKTAEAAAAKEAATFAEAEALLKDGRGPDHAGRAVALAAALARGGRPAEAVAWFAAAFESDEAEGFAPSDRAYLHAARVAAQAGDLARAVAWLAEDVAALRRAFAEGGFPPAVARELSALLRHERAFAPLRGAAADAPPAATRAAAEALWREVAAFDAEAASKP
jgi:serine/threonine protein kinase/Tfp pilus assembly protein PilF